MSSEFGNNGRDRGFEIKQAALVENHGHGGRGDDLRERSEIEEARSGNLWRSWIVCQTAESFVGDEFSAESDRQRASGESAGGDGFFQDADGARKLVILRGEIAHQEGKAGFSIGQRQVQGHFVN